MSYNRVEISELKNLLEKTKLHMIFKSIYVMLFGLRAFKAEKLFNLLDLLLTIERDANYDRKR